MSLDGVGDSHGTIRKPGDGRLQTPHAALMAARRNFTGKDQRPCSIGNDQMWLRRVLTLPFSGSHGRIDRMTVDTAWTPPGQGSWPQTAGP